MKTKWIQTKHILTAVVLTGLAAGTMSLPAQVNVGDKKADQTAPKAKPYPLEKCVVSDEKLGEMGKPVVLVHEGQEMKFCCKDCVKEFQKEPAKFLKKLADEAKKPKK